MPMFGNHILEKKGLTFPFLFLSPPKNLPIWSRRPGDLFFLPSPKGLCPEVLAVAILGVALFGDLQSGRPTNVLLNSIQSTLWGHSANLLDSLRHF